MNDVSKLPKWAQERIELLEMRLAESKRAFAEATMDAADAAVIVDPYGDYPHGLTADTDIHFNFGTNYINVRVFENGVRLRCQTGRLTIKADSSNCITVDVP